jgi:2,3-bisphosphoglycerate-independent phosphoglycerate mutase
MKKCFLIILDGLGINDNPVGNAWAQARAPFLNGLLKEYPSTTLTTHGVRVGLPEGQMGNSEVGHLNIGAGRVVNQSLVKITESIKDGSIKEATPFIRFTQAVSQSKSVHLMGLLSDGGVHSHQDHLIGLLKLLSAAPELEHIYLHIITDGRDTSPHGGLEYLTLLNTEIKSDPRIKIASLAGRYFSMDRDNRWERTQRGVAVMTGYGEGTPLTPLEYLKTRYNAGESDEFISPVRFDYYSPNKLSSPAPLLCWNFRADRMRQITTALLSSTFSEFPVSSPFTSATTLTLTEYDENFALPVLFPPSPIRNHIGEVISDQGLTQIRAAETEKYPHVTYFFNGGEEILLKGEDRVLVPSPKDVPTYDHKPEMSAFPLTAALRAKIETSSYSFGVLNYANCDMVGHTGILKAGIAAVEAVDTCLSSLVPFLINQQWCIVLIADHGNCEQMINYADNTPHTSHTTNPVPMILVQGPKDCSLASGGALCDVAPTILTIMGIQPPPEMTGRSLIVE